jgi:hypothetical protein
MEGLDSQMIKGIAAAGAGAVLYTYVLTNDHYIIPYEIILLFAMLCFGNGIYRIFKCMYLKWIKGPVQGSGYPSDSRFSQNGPNRRIESYPRPNMGPNYQGQANPYYDDRSRTGIYTAKSEELAETFMRAQAAKYLPEVRQPQSRPYEEPTNIFGFSKTYERVPTFLNPLNVGPQYEVDQGINCNRDAFDRTYNKVGLFKALPLHRETSSQPNKLFPNSMSDEATSRRESMMRANTKRSTSVNRTNWAPDSSHLSVHRTVSPYQKATVSNFESARPFLKKNTVMMKESTSLYYGKDKRSMLNQGNFAKAMESVLTVGGDEVTFNQSVKSLHNWISHKLLDKYYEDNRVCEGLTVEKHDGLEQSPSSVQQAAVRDRDPEGGPELLPHAAAAAERASTAEQDRERVVEQALQHLQLARVRAESVVGWPSRRTTVLGEVNARSAEEANKINQQFHKEFMERVRLDMYLRLPGVNFTDIRNYALGRIKDMRGYTDFNDLYEGARQKPNIPTNSEIILGLFLTFVLEAHPSLNVIDDYRDIMDNYTPPRSRNRL